MNEINEQLLGDNQTFDSSNEDTGKGFSLDTFISIFVLYWYWILLSMGACYGAAWLYLRYQVPVYQAKVQILVKDADQSRRRISNGSSLGLEEMGVISNSNGFANELVILGSTSISTRVVRALKLYTSYRFEGKIVDQELYRNSPIVADIAEEYLEGLNTPVRMVVTAHGKGFHVVGSVGGDPEKNPTFTRDFKEAELPATIQTVVGPVLLQRNPTAALGDRRLLITISPLVSMARAYAGKISSHGSNKENTVATVVITETQTQRALDYLNELIKSYNEDANEDKNEVARKTEAFLDERIDAIRKELDVTEGELENFKKDNRLINLPNDASAALASRNNFDQRQVEMQTQLILLQSLIDYVSDPNNAMQIIPSNLGLNNGELASVISKYNENVLLRNRLLKTGSESNPAVMKVTSDLEATWPTLAISLKATYQDMLVRKHSIDEQYKRFADVTYSTPTMERRLNNIGRQQESKAELYLMLLQKREQNYISLASTATKARMIDNPVFAGKISPQNQKIIMMALGVGFAFPIALFYLLGMMRYRIEGREDVERLTNIPILADIPLARHLEKDIRALVVSENNNSTMEETFRGLRTNLRFVLAPEEKVIACTSCIPSEGKTFVATNLAMSLAFMSKKVLIIGLDIRKPQLVRLFELESRKMGITNFLSGELPNVEDIDNLIFHGVKHKFLDVLPAGTIPPNPAELVARKTLEDAISYLRDKYDYIILDTPPVGLVSDTLEMARVTDATIFVVRADYSIKANFELINSIKREGKMPKVNLVLNGIDLNQKRYGYYYGYGKYSSYGKYGKYGYYSRYSHYGHYGAYGRYGYGYGYGHGAETANKTRTEK